MARQVTTDRETSTRPAGVRGPEFTGRDHELAALTQALVGAPAVVLVEGEAGIGKTRLIAEFLATSAARKARPLVAACPPLAHPHTLGPVIDALRPATPEVRRLALSPLAGALRPLFPDWTGMLPPAPEPAGDPSAERHRIFAALADLLTGLQAQVLVVEDAHWADEATLELLLFLATATPRPVSLLVTCRPEEIADGAPLRRLSRMACGARGLRLTLTPLDVTQTRHLVSSMLPGGQVSKQFAAFMHERTDGVPLAVEESVRLLGERDDIISRDGRWVRRSLAEIAVPPTVRDAVLERTARLTADAQAVARASAVLAAPAAEDTITAITGLSPARVRDGLGETLRCGLLSEIILNGCALVTFHHMLAARAVYEAITPPARRRLHHRAALALEQLSPRPAAQLAQHFREAGDVASWCRYTEQAADAALAVGDHHTAAGMLHDLVVSAGLSPSEVVRLARKVPLMGLARYASTADLAQSLRSVLDSDRLSADQRAEACLRLGQILTNTGDYEAGAAELERAIPGLAHRPQEAAFAMTWLGWPFRGMRPAAEYRRWLDRAAAAVSDPAVSASERRSILADRTTALLMMGEEEGWAGVAGFPPDAADPRDALALAVDWMNAGEMAIYWGRYAQARQLLAVALRLASRYQYARVRENVQVFLTHLDWFTGAWDGLAERTEALVADLADADAEPAARMEAALTAGLLDAAVGATDSAGRRLRLVLEEQKRRGTAGYIHEPAGASARLRLAGGQIDEALALTEDPVKMVAAKGIWLWATDVAPVRIQALTAAGRGAEAAELVRAYAAGLVGGHALPAPQAALLVCRAHLAETSGQHARASRLFARAEAAWAALPRPYDALLAREGQARCLLAAAQAEEGLEMLAGLRREFITLGALGDAERTVSTLRDHGVQARRPQRGGRRAYGDKLSPRELEVVRLVLGGRTNPQIAQVLSRSPRTVTVQLASAMRKLGVSSRAALAVVAVQTGVTPDDRTPACS